jgi:hypothetical protein
MLPWDSLSDKEHGTPSDSSFSFSESTLGQEQLAEANACVAGLLPYLRYLVGPELHSTVEKSFTAEAVER